MQKSDWKQRCEAALLVNATLTMQWSSACAERKRVTHVMFKVRQKLEELKSTLEGGGDEDYMYEQAFRLIDDALELTQLRSANVGKKAAKKEGLSIMFCEHANGCPAVCECPPECPCHRDVLDPHHPCAST